MIFLKSKELENLTKMIFFHGNFKFTEFEYCKIE